MNRKGIVTKTAKGMREASGATHFLARDLKALLHAVDGRSTPDDLAERLGRPSASAFDRTLERLAAEGYIQEAMLAPPGASDARDLDFTVYGHAADAPRDARADARRKAEETAQRWAAERARRRSEERARREADKQAQREAAARAAREAEETARREVDKAEIAARKAAAAQAKRATEERQRLEAEAQARRDAAARRKREAEDRARRAAEERAAREAQERAQRAAEEAARNAAIERTRREAEARSRREAEQLAQHAAEEQARLAAARVAAEARARREAEERAAQEAKERDRREAAAQARRKAEERARREAEAQAHREAAEQAAREAEERIRQEAAAQAKREAEEQARREAEASALSAAREHIRRAAAAHTRKEADECAWHKDAEALLREAGEAARSEAAAQVRQETAALALRAEQERQEREAAEHAAALHAETLRRERPAREVRVAAAAPTPYRRPLRWGRPLAFASLILLVGGLALLQLMSFDSQVARFEKIAAAQFHQPVKIRAVHLSLLLRPHWSLEGVTIGDAGQIQARRIRAIGEVGALLRDEAAFSVIEIEAPVLTEEGLGWLLLGRARGGGFGATRLEAHGAVLQSKAFRLPPFDASAEVGADGNWRRLQVGLAGTDLALDLAPADAAVKFSLASTRFALPFLADLPELAGFSAEGTADRAGLQVTQFEGRTHDGSVSGSARLRFGDAMTLEGEASAKHIDMARLIPGMFEGGLLEGAATFALPVPVPVPGAGKPAAAPRLAGSFVVQRGILAGIDMGSVLKDTGRGGRTRFARLEGALAMENGGAHLRQLRLDAGAMSARGSVDVAADRSLQGRFDVNLSAATTRRHAVLDLSGAFAAPYLKNADWTRR
ncbi:MAG: AsmA-like C-terminal region-containing protein [Rhodocyclaceae bacterium]|nr:AsmA-like C-terminal region-containing protein [Rhodocyclaceae bacterium]